NPNGPETPVEFQKAKDRLAALILKNTLASQAHASMTDQIHSHAPWEQKTFTATFSNVANHEARGAKMTLIHFAGSIPYVQGLLLYLLSMMFPFFALFLIMPGRYSAFFVWMALWVWVKSWDIGFAFIDVIRDILWKYTNPSLASAENQAFNWNDLSSVYALINTHDPLSGLNTYYTIVGILTIAVPAFTAHLCLGATNLFDAFKGTMGMQSQEFGRRMTKRSKNFEWSEVENYMAARKAQEAKAAAEAAGYNPQQAEDGTWRASTTDAAKNRHMDAEMKMARYKQQFSQENMELRQYAAMLSRRKMGYNNGASLDYISAKANGVTEKYMGRSMAGDTSAPWGSTKGSSSDHTAGFIRQGAGSTIPIAGTDGE
ncbi:MAG: conjugal transfer protein TraG N-terminal domain-containing protein, partial [Bdellovibrionales bacterium]|nr:conjugal transfer protein TraG N-terminal domain-containing protein [Bdellovibrionales bacterium]